MARLQKRLLLLVTAMVPLLLMLQGCSGGGSGLFTVDTQTEINIGQQAAADLERQYGVVNDPVQLARIQRIGKAISSVSSRSGLPWTFRILNINDVNALSLPGGFIYVTRGLLATNLPDNELAGVLGHEIAHVVERHSVKTIERNMTYSLLSELVLGGSSQAVQTAANIAIQVALELPHSRQDEYESDAVGTRLAYNAGFPANGLLLFLTRLQQLAGAGGGPDWLQTHPATTDRIAREQQLVTQIQGQPRPVPVALSDEELKVLKAMGADQAPKTATAPAAPVPEQAIEPR